MFVVTKKNLLDTQVQYILHLFKKKTSLDNLVFGGNWSTISLCHPNKPSPSNSLFKGMWRRLAN